MVSLALLYSVSHNVLYSFLHHCCHCRKLDDYIHTNPQANPVILWRIGNIMAKLEECNNNNKSNNISH